MNETSSRSHAVLTLLVTQREINATSESVGEKVSLLFCLSLSHLTITLVEIASGPRWLALKPRGKMRKGESLLEALTSSSITIKLLFKIFVRHLARQSSQADVGASFGKWCSFSSVIHPLCSNRSNKRYSYHFMIISGQGWTLAVERKTLLVPWLSLNAFSELCGSVRKLKVFNEFLRVNNAVYWFIGNYRNYR